MTSSGKMVSLNACIRLTPAVVYVLWGVLFVVWGTMAVTQDWSITKQSCGKATHVVKYAVLNVMFTIMSVMSYLLFPGGGEGARARAVVILTLHFGFATWGFLMWSSVDTPCATMLNEHYQAIILFQHVAVVYNFLLMTFFAIHEAYLGHKLRFDLTLLPEKMPVKV